MQIHDMNNIITISFDYNRRVYAALVSIKKRPERTEYRITIMNGELEKLFFGHHILVENDGYFITDNRIENVAIKHLRETIIMALKNYDLNSGNPGWCKSFTEK